MPTCKYCAEEITGSEYECPHCGSQLKKPPKPQAKSTGSGSGLAMPTCKYCAEEITGNEYECPHCGSQLKKPPKPQAKSTDSGSGKTIAIVVIIVFVLGVGGVAAWFILPGGEKAEADEQTVTILDEMHTKPALVTEPVQTPATKPIPAPEVEPTPTPTPEPGKPAEPPLVMVSVSGVPDISLDEPAEYQIRASKTYNNQGMRAYDQKDYTLAIAKFIKALEADPSSHKARFNLACTYALNGEADKALDILQQFKIADCEKCRERLAKAKIDSDFDSIRNHPRYQRIVEE
jgi:hypothetical protein